ncbi:hypothetical protein EJB05_00823, partial [Eragrostis curvula]
MTEEVVKEVVTSSTAPAAGTVDGNSVPPDIKRKEKPVPHYLRASTRSCHDNCKFGTHHSPESKKHWPVLRAQLRRASTGKQETGRVEILLPKRTGPKKDQKLKISHVKDGHATAPAKPEPTNFKEPMEMVHDHSESIPCIEDLPAEASEPGNQESVAECFVISHDDVADFGDGELSDGAESIELEMPLAIQDSDDSDEQMEDSIPPSQDVCEAEKGSPLNDVYDQSANECVISEKTASQNMMIPKKHEQADPETKSRRSVTKPVKPMVKGTSSVARNTSLRHRSERTSRPKAAGAAVEIATEAKPMSARTEANGTTTATKFSRQKTISPTVTSAMPKVKEIKVASPCNATDSSAKPARLSKPKNSTAKSVLSPSVSLEKQTDRKMTVKNVARNVQVQQKQREEKVTPRPLKLSRSLNMPAKSISSVKVRTVRREKIAPPIKTSKKVSGTENGAADAKEKFVKTASPKVQKPEVINKQSRPGKEKTDTPTLRTRITRASKPATITSTTQSPRKLTFRRGKVLNPDEGSSSSTPRRLRFRPAMAAADAIVRSRGSRVTGKGTGRGAAGARDAGTSRTEVVVLRRRQGGVTGGEEKKQEQVLLNNVIEATASRLVSEAKKSKVKALVGAFETVISLQEGGRAGPPAASSAAVAQ